ncbi:MAG: hypothetical protein R3C05_24960 [Pirellulaceae bacterium]
MSNVRIVQADLTCIEHQTAVLTLMDAYSSDPMGMIGRFRNTPRRISSQD